MIVSGLWRLCVGFPMVIATLPPTKRGVQRSGSEPAPAGNKTSCHMTRFQAANSGRAHAAAFSTAASRSWHQGRQETNTAVHR